MIDSQQTLPPDFDWKSYLELNSDLGNAGIDSEQDAIQHYIDYGHSEKRVYKRQVIVPNLKYENSSVIIIGTSREIEVFRDKELTERVENQLPVLCINTAFHYFNRISCLFLNGRFQNIDPAEIAYKSIDEIYAPFAWRTKDRNVRHFRIQVDKENYCPEISFDLNNPLPHGPTTMLDIVFPFCVFNKVSTIYIIGAEYQTGHNEQVRHSQDNKYVNRSIPGMNRRLEYEFALQKLDVWHKYFQANQINCYALSQESNSPFQTKSLGEILKV